MDGWIKLHRKIMDSAVWAKPELLKAWMYCLLKACHKPQHFNIKTGKGTTVVSIEAGQLIWGRQKAGKELEMVPKTAERHIKRLGQLNMLKRETFRHYSILTISNWSEYQEIKQINVPPMSNQSPTNVPPMSTYKNVKNINNEEKKDTTPNSSFKFALWGQIKQAVNKSFEMHSLESDNKHFKQLQYDIREVIKAKKKAQGKTPEVNDAECIGVINKVLNNWPDWAKDKTPSYFRHNLSSLLNHVRTNKPSGIGYKKLN